MPSVRAWIVIGVALRAALLCLSVPIELQSDEAHYAWLGLGWERFGYLTDSQRFLWPPAYPFLHKLGFQLFEERGVDAVRYLQISASIATGWGTAALAQRLISARAAKLAVALWALHLPLAAFCSLGWPDSLFIALLLPGLVLLHDGASAMDQRKLVAAGLLLGVSALFKEIGLALALLSAVWLAAHLHKTCKENATPASLAFVFALFLPLAPWAARNLEHYGAPILSGKTLGENLYHGWNAHDHNFDVLPAARAQGPEARPDTSSISAFKADAAGSWPRPGGATLVERDSAKSSRGLEWAAAHPLDWARTRVSKAAHMLAPVSFPVRNIALGNYGGALGGGLLGRSFLLLATLQSIILIVFGAAALARNTPRHAVFWIPTCALLAQPLLVGMSRLRIPLTPFFIIAIAGALTTAGSAASRTRGRIAVAAVCLLVLVDHRPILWLLQRAWGET
ncbi:MAG: hypothetical protein CL933_06705 [Deltaproteobacteria bacterium]|nr:hypothetical protein [Deltaproteobacteria bacterium]